jgi:hypothetical protein
VKRSRQDGSVPKELTGRSGLLGVVGLLAAAILLAVGLSPAAAAAPGAGRTASRATAAAAPGRYVVLGDSVAYGHGLADPGRSGHSGLPPDQGPSELAWPSLVDAALPGLAPLALRPTGCGLTGPGAPYDQLAISGAPVVDGPWAPTDGDCRRPGAPAGPHPAVVSDELDAARLAADPPVLVTIQAGADDLDFAGCLEALLGVPAVLGGDRCVTDGRDGPRLTARATAEIGEVRRGLRAAVDAVHTSAPHAQVVVVDYYQPIPAPTAAVRGTSAVCRDLRLRTRLGLGPPSTSWRAVTRAEADLVQQRLDGAIRSVADSYPDVRLVDIAGLFAGHELCTTDSWLFDVPWAAAHPTAIGQQHIAAAVMATCARLRRHCLGR